MIGIMGCVSKQRLVAHVDSYAKEHQKILRLVLTLSGSEKDYSLLPTDLRVEGHQDKE